MPADRSRAFMPAASPNRFPLAATMSPRTPAAFLLVVLAAALSGCEQFHNQPLSPEKSARALDSRSLDEPALATWIAGHGGRKRQGVWDFEALTLAAFYFHPSLDVARAHWRVAQAGLETAAARPNPSIGLIPGYDVTGGSGLSPWLANLDFNWPIETSGKRARRMDKARAEAEAARMQLASAAWELRVKLRESIVAMKAAELRAGHLEKQGAALREVVKLLEQRQAAGTVSVSEVTPARLNAIKSANDMADARRQAAVARTQVAEALGVPTRALGGVAIAMEAAPPSSAGRLLSAEARRQALQHRADILAALAEYAASEADLRLQMAKQYPDINLGPAYEFDQGDNKWHLGLTVEIPLLNRNRGPIAEAKARREEAGAKFLQVQAKALAEIDRATVNYGAEQDQLKRSADLVKEEQREFELKQNALQAGAVDVLEAKLTEVELMAAGLSHLEVQARVQAAYGQLEDALQLSIDSLRLVEQGRTPPL
jgi:outer membrane protein, heavy metal efflux system